MQKQNELNFSLQGKTSHIYKMWQKVQAFRKKLIFLRLLLLKSRIFNEHFDQLSKFITVQESVDPSIFNSYIEVLNVLIEEYNDGFLDFEKYNIVLKLTF
ncbi:hypothetical protein DMUE_0461 [Dictyocoela muelleri]|nr:hypothetical protein DMUE_0461 [Dictyocoela muelleri]